MTENILEKYNLSVLFVENNKEVRELYAELLEEKVEKLIVLDNAIDAIEIYKINSIDLVIADIKMPILNGLQMSEELRKINPEVKIILITGNSDFKNLLSAINLGIDTYLIKPVEFSKLDKELNKFNKLINFEKEHAKKDQLLNEYKKAVDLSCIVSETDVNGNIIYVNSQFEDITGFKFEELIGRTHKMIKHPHTHEKVFEEIWRTIKTNKIPWNGVLKNKRKDGSEFYTNTFINPILNDKNEIIKFIALRTDVTEIEQSKEKITNQYHEVNQNYENANSLINIYEKVIDESNVIIKINDEYKITYVNDVFCQLTKYKKNELVNQSFFSFEDKRLIDNRKEIDKFTDANREGIWKGKINIIDKLGNVLDLIATISSIKNKSGDILEYMIFIQDITEIIHLHKEFEEAQREIIYKMGEIVESKSQETGLHVKRVSEYSKLLALKYGMSFKESELIKFASPMHDIGKIAINDSILHKRGKLTLEEYEIMKSHANIGYELLNNSNIEILRVASIISHEHHERWDGKGYPRGLIGENIHIYGRITAIADVFDALSTSRAYKEAWELDDILNLFRKERGKHFDPYLIDLFFENLNEFLEIKEKFK